MSADRTSSWVHQSLDGYERELENARKIPHFERPELRRAFWGASAIASREKLAEDFGEKAGGTPYLPSKVWEILGGLACCITSIGCMKPYEVIEAEARLRQLIEVAERERDLPGSLHPEVALRQAHVSVLERKFALDRQTT